MDGEWFWINKLNWSKQEWKSYVSRVNLQTWGTWLHGGACAYFELEQKETETTETAYLGIQKQFSGCSLGKKLLLETMAIAEKERQRRVIVTTCNLTTQLRGLIT